MQDEEQVPSADEEREPDVVDSSGPPEPVVVIDPSGPPEPVAVSDPVQGAISFAGVVAVALGGLLMAMFATTGSTRGATRSVKIQWEERQQQIDEAACENRAAQLASALPTVEDGSHVGPQQ
jgi:hypothetical protein